MGRTVEAAKAVNANVRQLITTDLDLMSEAAENGTVPAAVAATCVATEYGNNVLHKTVLTCTALPLSIADDASHTAGTGTFTGTITLLWSKI